MNQVSTKMRRAPGRFFHYCPGCEQAHPLPDNGWTWNNSLERPTFSPSFMQNRGDPRQCHYVITDGVLNYCSDSWHALRGQRVPMPELPQWLRDFDFS